MPGKILAFVTVCFFSLLVATAPVFAQPTSAPTGKPVCDLCGWCNPIINTVPPPNWTSCNTCIYDAGGNTIPNNYYTVFGCLSTKPERFVQSMLTIVLGIAGGIAFLTVLGGAAMVLTAGGDPERLKSGKDLITSSLLGLLLIVFSVFLLRTVGLDILQIPGFG